MNDKIFGIQLRMDAPDATDYEKGLDIYYTYIKPLEDAIEDAEERERVLVEALEGMLLAYGEPECQCDSFEERMVHIARFALASVKEMKDAIRK